MVPRLFNENQNVDEEYAILHENEEFRKIIITKDPFSRLYDGWKDKLRKYQYENGTLKDVGRLYKVYDRH